MHCPSYDVAFDILKEHKYILITGQPGVGKTTLAYYLTYHYLASGYQLLYVDTDISQASTLLSADPNIKQIIFFDDFLGEIYLELIRPKATESAIVLLLERILASENKYLIMTTRTTVYTHALGKYEKLERMKVDIARKEIVLGQYSLLDKARILQKHVFYTDIPDEYKETFFENRNYWEVIDHPNYNPRLIEFVTSRRHIPKGTSSEYWQFVLQTLHNPKEVWRHFYLHQLSTEERLLLHVIFTQNYSATAEDTRQIFQHMLEYEIRHYNFRPVLSPFQHAGKNLLDGTIKKELFAYNIKGRFSFIDPSLADFLKHYFLNTDEERKKLLQSACMVEQFEHYNQTFFSVEQYMPGKERQEAIWFSRLLMSRADSMDTYQELKREFSREKYLRLRIAALLSRVITNNDEVDKHMMRFVFDAVCAYPIDGINKESLEYYVDSIKDAPRHSDLYQYVVKNWMAVINKLFQACVRESDFEKVKELFYYYNQSFKAYIADQKNDEVLAMGIQDLADGRTVDWMRDEQSSIRSESISYSQGPCAPFLLL